MATDFQESNYWLTTAHNARWRPRVNFLIELDVVVIGAGYTGLSAARTLAKRGVEGRRA